MCWRRALWKTCERRLDLPQVGYRAEAITGFAATTYFGGRAEVHVRSQVEEMLHLDFKSQYVAGSDLMGVQDIWLAKDVGLRDTTREIRTWLTATSSAELLSLLCDPPTWPRLLALVCIRPDRRITLPARTDFQQNCRHPSGISNIGQAYVRSKIPLWYTLGELLVGIIRDEAVRPDEIGGSGQDAGNDAEEAVAELLEEVLAAALLSRESTALYSPYITSGPEAAQAVARGEIRCIGNNKPVPPQTDLKSMHAVVTHYFTHGEAKAANP